jgi:hypothetical protein
MATEKYMVKKPVVEAVQWKGDNAEEVVDMVDGGVAAVVGDTITISSSEGNVIAALGLGDYILRHAPGEPVWSKTEAALHKDYERYVH